MVLLDTEANAEGDTCPQQRYWQVFASFIPAAHDSPALLALRDDDVTARVLAGVVLATPTRYPSCSTGSSKSPLNRAVAWAA